MHYLFVNFIYAISLAILYWDCWPACRHGSYFSCCNSFKWKFRQWRQCYV